MTGEIYNKLLEEIKIITDSSYEQYSKLSSVCKLLKENISYFDWVGFYLVDPANERELILGPFSGKSTEHIRIPFGKGICGQAADNEETFVVQDVEKEDNYLSCDINVKSEIVVPIFKNNKIVGELDIDSHKKNPFDNEVKLFLEEVCRVISKVF